MSTRPALLFLLCACSGPVAAPPLGPTAAPSQTPATPGETPVVPAETPPPASRDGVCPRGPFGSPLPRNATPQLLAEAPGADWSEGPVWLAARQLLLFSAARQADADAQGPKTAIYAFTPPRALSLWTSAGTVRSNGLVVDPNGDVVALVHDVQEVVRLPGGDAGGRTTLSRQYGGKPYNSPNDAAIGRDGSVYFTDPTYEQVGRPGQDEARTYRIAPDGNVTVVDDSLQQPNGIAVSLDGRSLFVGGADGLIKRFAIADDGSTGPGEPWATPADGIDGMTIDCAGNLYVTLIRSQGVAIYDPSGAEIGRLPVGGTVSNVAFGGHDRRTLFISGGGKLWGLTMPVPGWPY